VISFCLAHNYPDRIQGQEILSLSLLSSQHSVSELSQQQGLRDKQMKNQSDNGVFKMGITGAEDVMASLMLLLSIA